MSLALGLPVARNFRNRLMHGYMIGSTKFVEDLCLAKEYSLMLMETFKRVRQDAMTRMGHKKESLPEELLRPNQVRSR